MLACISWAAYRSPTPRRCSGPWPYLRRIPDGETGERRRWIWFQRTMLENHPDMELDPTVPLLLGLIHHDDAKGDVARIEAARAFVKTFGVASECGWGRTDPERVPDLLLSHRAAAEFIRQGGVTS
jgi:hypothetical protein